MEKPASNGEDPPLSFRTRDRAQAGQGRDLAGRGWCRPWLTPGRAQCSDREHFTTSTSSIFFMLFLQMAPSWFLFQLQKGCSDASRSPAPGESLGGLLL